MKLLILGGTKFLGRHLVEAALARGHEVTLFNRGETSPDLFPEAEKLRGDRDGGLDPLRGQSWDAVVDTSGYVPRVVRASAELLADGVGRYLFVSSISAYAGFAEGPSEESPLAELEDPATEEVTGEAYGGLKALCERAVRDVYDGRALIVRPGLIVGAHDPTGRFTYWPHRFARGGEVLAPGPPERRVQFVDARDLAGWMLRLLDAGAAGAYNATGTGVTMGRLLEECCAVSGSDASVVWVPDEFLVEHGVGEWMELPLWIADPAWRGMLAADVSKAIAAGLTFRPLAETIADTLADAASGDGVGLAPERERELLEAWRRRR